MKKINWNDVGKRALKTFIQAVVAYAVADGTVLANALSDMNAGKQVLITIGVGALAAGVSAVWNTVINPILEEETKAGSDANV